MTTIEGLGTSLIDGKWGGGVGVGVGGHIGSLTSCCSGRNKDRTRESGGNRV